MRYQFVARVTVSQNVSAVSATTVAVCKYTSLICLYRRAISDGNALEIVLIVGDVYSTRCLRQSRASAHSSCFSIAFRRSITVSGMQTNIMTPDGLGA